MANRNSLLLIGGLMFWSVLGFSTTDLNLRIFKEGDKGHGAAKIFPLKGEALLFRQERAVTSDGDKIRIERKFVSTDGEVAAVEEATYEKGLLTEFRINQKQTKLSGSVKVDGKKLKFLKSDNGKTSEDTEDATEDFVAPDQIYPYLLGHWDEILKGDSVKIRFPVIERAETVGFKFFKDREETRDGKKVIIVKMKPSSFVIAALVDPLYFTIEREGDRKLLQIEGRTSLMVKVGEKWKALDARLVFE